MAVILGTDLDDSLFGETDDDLIFGFKGDNFLAGGVGNDRIFGGPGDDSLFGDGDTEDFDPPFDDSLFGGSGNDFLSGELGDDSLFGGSGNDFLLGGLGDDLLKGGSGDDILTDGSFVFGVFRGGNDIFIGGSGNDRLDSGDGNDTLLGGSGNDTLLGGFDNDRLHGGSGDDILNGARDETGDAPFGEGTDEIDTLTSGSGSDTFQFFGSLSSRFNFQPRVVYYDDSGLGDYALITDFNPSKDVIQLAATERRSFSFPPVPVNYSLGISSEGLPAGTGLFAAVDSAEPDLIAILQGLSLSDLDLSASYFSYISSDFE